LQFQKKVLPLIQQNRNAMKYATYIVTAWETEIEKEFPTKKKMLDYLANEIFAKKDMQSLCVLAFSLDNEGYKTVLKTKYSFDNRF
jgi:hypothetical protein